MTKADIVAEIAEKTGLEKGEYYVNQIAPTIAKLTGVTIENKKAGNPIIIK